MLVWSQTAPPGIAAACAITARTAAVSVSIVITNTASRTAWAGVWLGPLPRPVFDAIGSKTVRLAPEAGRASRTKLVAGAWTVALAESLRAQLSRAARSRRSARRPD
jgi:hypothetical protein